MSEYKQHINYTATDIQQYVQGKLSSAEMHAMEKAALEDPFLADAIEGMQIALQEHDLNTINSQLQQAQKQLQHRVKPAVVAAKPASPASPASPATAGKVVSFVWWKAAAAAAIIIVGGVWIYHAVTDKTTPSTVLARKEEKARAQQPAPVQSTADSTAATLLPPVRPAATPNKKTSIPQAAAAEAPVVSAQKARTDTVSATRAFAEAKKEAIQDALATTRQNNRQFARNQVPPAPVNNQSNDFNNRPTELITIAKTDSQNKQAVMSNKALTGFVKGIVTDPFKNPVANAYVSYPGLNNRYDILTDKTGHFKIPTNDSVVDVAVNVVGYGTQNFRLQNNVSLNELQLKPASSPLNEVVVTGMDKKGGGKYRSGYPRVVTQDAEPVYGWLAYEQYLEKNKIRPAGFEHVTGAVSVSFTVNRKGELSDFKIEKSLAKQLDDEAIRLIAQGPAWKLLKGRKARTTVIVKF